MTEEKKLHSFPAKGVWDNPYTGISAAFVAIRVYLVIETEHEFIRISELSFLLFCYLNYIRSVKHQTLCWKSFIYFFTPLCLQMDGM